MRRASQLVYKPNPVTTPLLIIVGLVVVAVVFHIILSANQPIPDEFSPYIAVSEQKEAEVFNTLLNRGNDLANISISRERENHVFELLQSRSY